MFFSHCYVILMENIAKYLVYNYSSLHLQTGLSTMKLTLKFFAQVLDNC